MLRETNDYLNHKVITQKIVTFVKYKTRSNCSATESRTKEMRNETILLSNRSRTKEPITKKTKPRNLFLIYFWSALCKAHNFKPIFQISIFDVGFLNVIVIRRR